MNCFVIMPFGDKKTTPDQADMFDHIYYEWIKPSIESYIESKSGHPLHCSRADTSHKPEEIVGHIVQQLATADIVIADLTRANPNVLYELGVRHALRGNAILLCQDLADVPFDLRGLRVIVYEFSAPGMVSLRKALLCALDEVIGEGTHIENPVLRYLQNERMKEIVSGEVSKDGGILARLQTEFRDLRRAFENESQSVRDMLKHLTESSTVLPSMPAVQRHVAEQFQGMWVDNFGGLSCAKVVRGELRIPYCFGGTRRLTSHIYNIRVCDDTVVGRFEWFSGEIDGYVYLRLSDPDHLEGGWWYEHEVPPAVAFDPSALAKKPKGMHFLMLTKNRKRKKWPKWATDYYKTIASST